MKNPIETINKFKDTLTAIKEELSPTVIKSFPMKSEWRKRYAELEKATEEAFKAEQKHKTLKSSFWTQVEIDLGIYDKPLHYNEETDEIEVLEVND